MLSLGSHQPFLRRGAQMRPNRRRVRLPEVAPEHEGGRYVRLPRRPAVLIPPATTWVRRANESDAAYHTRILAYAEAHSGPYEGPESRTRDDTDVALIATPEFRALVKRLAETMGGLAPLERALAKHNRSLPARHRVGISRRTVGRIVGGRAVRWRVLQALAQIVPQLGAGNQSAQDWSRALYPGLAALALGRYRRWLRAHEAGSLWFLVFQELEPKEQRLVRRYEARWHRAGHEPARVAEAVRRALHGLSVDALVGPAWRIEPTAADLRSRNCLRRYLWHSLRREDLLFQAQGKPALEKAWHLYARGQPGARWWSLLTKEARGDATRRIKAWRDFRRFVQEVERNAASSRAGRGHEAAIR